MTDLETTERRLNELADRVRKHTDSAADAVVALTDGYLHIGHALLEARELLKSNQRYGEWFTNQRFGFSTQWGALLRRAAACEQGVRAAFETQVSNGDLPNLREAVKLAEAALPPKASKPVVVDESTTEDEKPAIKADVFEQDPHGPADVGEHHPEPGEQGQATGSTEPAGTAPPATDGDSDETSDVGGRAPASRAPVDTADRDRSPTPGSRSATKPTHKIPLREAGGTLYRAITTLESLVADRHNGADVVDYWLDETGAHLDDIERQLTAAAKFIADAQIVINQRKRAVA